MRGFGTVSVALIGGLLVAGCQSARSDANRETSGLITDKTHGNGRPGTYGMPRIVTGGGPFTTIDATALSATPAVSLRVDLVAANGNLTNKATFTGTSNPKIVLHTTADATNFPGTPAPFYGVV